MNVLGELNESLITREEVKEAVSVMKSGKAAGMDECAVCCGVFKRWWNYCC